MLTMFYLTAAIATVSAVMVVGRANAVHSLLYLVVTMMAIAVLFYLLGAPFAAALEVIVYAGAITVLMVFVIMMLNQGDAATEQEQQWLLPRSWWGPALLSGILLVELLAMISGDSMAVANGVVVSAKEVGIALYGPYLLAVELASLLLMSGLVGAYHIARSLKPNDEENEELSP
ncbi:MAG: NADH-quinone oxidoreductase subunit J [Pseudomonadales bacterium]